MWWISDEDDDERFFTQAENTLSTLEAPPERVRMQPVEFENLIPRNDCARFIKGVFRSVRSWRTATWGRIFLVLLFVAAMIVGVVLFTINMGKILIWVNSIGWWGSIFFGGIYVISLILFIPSFVPTVAVGFVFGTLLGVTIIMIGHAIATAISFYLGRYLLRGWVEKRIAKYPKFQAIDKAIETKGFQIVFLLSLSPMMPLSLLNYSLSITKVRFRDFFIATLLGTIPPTIVLVYLGSTAKDFMTILSGETGPNKTIQIIFLITSVIFTFAAIALVTWVSRRVIKKTLEEERQRSVMTMSALDLFRTKRSLLRQIRSYILHFHGNHPHHERIDDDSATEMETIWVGGANGTSGVDDLVVAYERARKQTREQSPPPMGEEIAITPLPDAELNDVVVVYDRLPLSTSVPNSPTPSLNHMPSQPSALAQSSDNTSAIAAPPTPSGETTPAPSTPTTASTTKEKEKRKLVRSAKGKRKGKGKVKHKSELQPLTSGHSPGGEDSPSLPHAEPRPVAQKA